MHHPTAKYILDALAAGKPLSSHADNHPAHFPADEVARGIEWLSNQGYIVAQFQTRPGKPQVAHARAMLLSGDNFRHTLH